MGIIKSFNAFTGEWENTTSTDLGPLLPATISVIYVYIGEGDITAEVGGGYDIPAGSLPSNINFNVAALTTDGDYIEIYNRDVSYSVTFTGASVYLSDETVQTDAPALTNMQIRRVNGNLRIIN